MLSSRTTRLVMCAAGLCLAGALVRETWLRAEPARDPRAETTTPVASVQGSLSCASASCHHQERARAVKGNEYGVWVEADPHARAYQVLFDDRSQRIVRNLGVTTSAEKTAVCLKCHSYPDRGGEGSSAGSDGVGCEACHGPAERWLTTHYLPGWNASAGAQRESTGFRETKDLVARATQCVGCHVGRPGAEVGHDLIAAGHPALRFEFGSYSAIYPRHWDRRDDTARTPDWEFRAWRVGRLVAAGAALALLEHRAGDEHAAWPEFAESACFSCHHDLSGVPKRGSTRRVFAGGALPWGTWYTSHLTTALPPTSDGPGDPIRIALAGLQDEMSRPVPRRRVVVPRAAELRRLIESRARSAADTADDPVSLRRAWDALHPDDPAATQTWEAATQRYLALAAVHAAMADLAPGQLDPTWRAELGALRDRLVFRKSTDGPADFSPLVPPGPRRGPSLGK